MSQVSDTPPSDTPPSGQPPADWPPADAPSYQYDPHLGSPRDSYRRVDIRTSRLHHPELAGRFVAYVQGDTMVGSAMGRRLLQWRTEPGTPCLILGHWSDGSVHLKWRIGYYSIDGRFPAWVVAEDTTAKMAGGGRMLLANELSSARPNLLPQVIRLGLAALARRLRASLSGTSSRP